MIYFHDFDISRIFENAKILKRKRGYRAPQKKRRDYISILSCFDIETTRIKEIDNSVMYIWQWGFFDLKTNQHIATLYGRTWEDYLTLCEQIQSEISALKTDDTDIYMVRLVHNLSYEFQFLSGIHHYNPEDVFIIRDRKILKADSFGCIEDRCTYLHSNLSLDKYAKQWGAKHEKLSGEDFDYSKERYYFTPLTISELLYCEHDILSCLEAYTNEMQYFGDDLYTVPLTVTGYVRRDAKNVWYKIPFYTRKKWTISNEQLYTLLSKAFRGGNTHANRFFVAPEDNPPFVIEHVKSFDRSSSYPDVMCNRKFPLGTWRKDGKQGQIERAKKGGNAFVMRVLFTNIDLQDVYWPVPYLSWDKSTVIGQYVIDNGRLIRADSLETCITDVDLQIIESEYKWAKMDILEFYYCPYMPLPGLFTDLIRDYYRRKTELKGVDGREWEYAEAKSKINSLYGMCAQKTVRDQILFMDDENGLYGIQKGDAMAQLANAERRGFLPFSIGVWVTAWARYELERAIKLIFDTKGAYFLYTDTDSVKFTGDVDFSALNADLQAASEKSKSYATDKKGKVHYMGIYEYEGEYPKFATMGAKKYVYGDDEKLHVTIAGVVKWKNGVDISAQELKEKGGFSAFRAGTVFVKAGGIEAVYNDSADFYIEKDGAKIHVTRNVCLRPSTYTLGLSAEYDNLLKNIILGVDDNPEMVYNKKRGRTSTK